MQQIVKSAPPGNIATTTAGHRAKIVLPEKGWVMLQLIAQNMIMHPTAIFVLWANGMTRWVLLSASFVLQERSYPIMEQTPANMMSHTIASFVGMVCGAMSDQPNANSAQVENIWMMPASMQRSMPPSKHAKVVLKEHGQRRQGPVVARSPAPPENLAKSWHLHQRPWLAIFAIQTITKTSLVKTGVWRARMRDILAPGNPSNGRITRAQMTVMRRRLSFVWLPRAAARTEA